MDFLAGLLGLRKVGWVFTQAVGTAERDYIMSGSEVAAMAAMQVGRRVERRFVVVMAPDLRSLPPRAALASPSTRHLGQQISTAA